MDQIEQKIIRIIEENAQQIMDLGRRIWAYPELGYKEERTSALFAEFCAQHGLTVEKGLAVTGVKGYLKPPAAGDITVALMGELDALPMSDSPYAHAETGAVHACGHNAQMAGVMGAMLALSVPEIKEALGGNVVFFAAPSEEFVEIEFKQGLMEKGIIGYGGGKSELIRIGAFDDIDLVVAHHTAPHTTLALSNHKSNGFMSKVIRYNGIAAHAAEAPHQGVDALNAAHIAMTAINCQRESFRDEDMVRVHGFVSKGGEAMNVIANQVTLEYSVRANNIPAMLDANEKFDRAIRAGAIATGCGAQIITMPGYLPVVPQENTAFLKEALADAAGSYTVCPYDPGVVKGASTDLGEVSHLKPVYQFNTGGYTGNLHQKDNHPEDEYLAYVVTAKVFALAAYKLLKNKAEQAREIVSGHKPLLTKEEYIAYMQSHNSTETIPMAPLPLLD